MAIHQLQTSFNAGELTPLMDARVGVEKYANGCRRLRNFMVSVHGPVLKRPGMEYRGPVGTIHCRRLTGLDFGGGESYVTEWNQYLWRWWKNGALLAFTLAHPYINGHIEEVQMCQVNDIIYLVHPAYAPCVLERHGDNDWRYRELFTEGGKLVGWPAMGDENITPVTVASSAIAVGATTNLVASAPLWTAQHVNAWWQIAHRRAAAMVDIVITEPSPPATFPAKTSASLRVLGKWSVITYGIWNTTVILEELQSDGTWGTIRSWSSIGERNINDSGETVTDSTLRLRCLAGGYVAVAGSFPAPRFVLEAADAKVYGLVRITGFTDSTHVTGMIWAPLWSTDPTPLWTEGAFSPARGHPRTVCLHQGRLYFGGTFAEPQTIWASVIEDFENFRESSLDDGAFQRQIAADRAFEINWLLSHGDLMIGTSLNEWVGTVSQDAAVTPLNLTFRRQSANGSDYRQAMLIRETVIYTQRGGLSLCRLSYSESGRYSSSDLSILASHLFLSKVVDIAWQQQASSVLWIVMGNGRLVGLTYEESQNVFACHEHVTDGLVKSVTVIHGVETDEVWVLVERGGVRSMERLEPGTLAAGALLPGDPYKLCFLDASRYAENATPFDVFSGLSHLDGRTVSVYADGAEQPPRVVSGGMVPIDPPASKVWVGLPYLSELQTMKLEAQMRTGTAQGRKFKVVSAVVRLLNSLGGQVADSLEADSLPEVIQYREVGDAMDKPPPLFNGDKDLALQASHRTSVDIVVQHREPLPFNLCSIVAVVDIYE